jgi:hypothetical protein
MPGVEFEITKGWVKDKDFKRQERKYWQDKIGTKITLKDFMKGPISNTPEEADNPQSAGATASGTSGTSGTSGASGTSGTSGMTMVGPGTSGTSGTTGVSGTSGTSGTSEDKPTMRPTTQKKLEDAGFRPTPGENVADKTLLDSGVSVFGGNKSDAQLILMAKLKNMNIDSSTGSGTIFYLESGGSVSAKWIIYQK